MKKLHNTTKNIPTRDEAIELLWPYLPKIGDCIRRGWQAWEDFGNLSPELRRPLNATARASFVHCHIAEAAKRTFKGIPGVLLSQRKRGYLQVVFNEVIVLRFKKLNSNYHPGGIKTNQYKLFMSQSQLSFKGFELVQANLVGGYRLDHLQREISDVCVVCPEGSKNQWRFEIAATTTPKDIMFENESNESTAIVRAKGVERKGRKTSGE